VQKYIAGELVPKVDLEPAMERVILRLTIRLGTLVAAATGAIVTAIRFLKPRAGAFSLPQAKRKSKYTR
jgi:hypothetical protein